MLQKELRTNTFDEASNTIVISPERARVQRELAVYYEKLFMGDPSMNKLRDAYAIPVNTVKDIGRMEKMNAFCMEHMVCITSRPGDNVTYTNNWPHDELVGNTPPSSLHMWSDSAYLCY